MKLRIKTFLLGCITLSSVAACGQSSDNNVTVETVASETETANFIRQESDVFPTSWRNDRNGIQFDHVCQYRALIGSGNNDPNGYYYANAVFPHQLVFWTDSTTVIIEPTDRFRFKDLTNGGFRQVESLEKRC